MAPPEEELSAKLTEVGRRGDFNVPTPVTAIAVPPSPKERAFRSAVPEGLFTYSQ
jgi:hypothetical protein